VRHRQKRARAVLVVVVLRRPGAALAAFVAPPCLCCATMINLPVLVAGVVLLALFSPSCCRPTCSGGAQARKPLR
jgi:hypothetical protein